MKMKKLKKKKEQNYIKAKSLSQDELRNLIIIKIDRENINYYQITSYKNIIAEQLIFFQDLLI